jgi:hypothetical protein
MLLIGFNNDEQIMIQNTDTNSEIVIQVLETEEITTMKFSSDCSVVGLKDNEVQGLNIYDTTTGNHLRNIYDCHDFAFDPTSQEMIISTTTELRIQSSDGDIIARTGHNNGYFLSYSSDGSRLLACDYVQSIVMLYNARTLELLGSTKVSDELYNLEFTFDGDYIIANCIFGEEHYMFVLDGHRLTVKSFVVDGELYRNQVYPVGNSYMTRNRDRDRYRVHNIDDGTETVLNMTPGYTIELFSSHGRYAAGVLEGEVRLFDLEDGTNRVIDGFPYGISDISPEGASTVLM